MTYQEILNDYFSIKREANPAYSLRAFARDLGLPSSNLSRVLRSELGLSKESAVLITEKLKMTPSESAEFIDLVMASCARSEQDRKRAKNRIEVLERGLSDNRQIREDSFKAISDWHYFAILEMLELPKYMNDIPLMAERLDLEMPELQDMLSGLDRLGLIKKVKNGYRSTGAQITSGNDRPSQSQKKHHAQILAKAQSALWEQDVEEREYSSLTIAAHPEDVLWVKTQMREFMQKMNRELMEKGKGRESEEVYCLSFQYFNLLKNQNEIKGEVK